MLIIITSKYIYYDKDLIILKTIFKPLYIIRNFIKYLFEFISDIRFIKTYYTTYDNIYSYILNYSDSE